MAEVTYSKPLRSDGGAGNVDCMRLAEIIREVVAAPRGDGIDTGLILLRRLAEFGYHVVHRQEILPCGCDVVNTGTWVRKKCGCLPVSAVRPSVETSAPPFDVEKAKRAVRYDQKRFGNADETSAALKAADVVPGREFIWMPDVPGARCRVRVDMVRHDPNGDIRVLTTTLESSGLSLAGDKTWNDMSRFLEACTAANG